MSTGFPVSRYEVKMSSCQVGRERWFGLRRFSSRGKNFQFLINPQNLETVIADERCLVCKEATLSELPEGPYRRALVQQQSTGSRQVDSGLTHATKSSAYYLTVDLCPSRRAFDSVIFDHPKVRSQANFPVAISLSGGWMNHYSEEFSGLKSRALQSRLNVVWVNHSYSHPYRRGIPNESNFLLMPSVNFDAEVLKQEQYMISKGIRPSIFFRFPGLVSNQVTMTRLTSYGLLALGADAWLALGQRPKPGSILLIHGNGNEEPGVELFLRLLNALPSLDIFRNLNEAP